MDKEIGLLYLPPVDGMPEMEEGHVRRLRERVPSVDWRVCGDKEELARLLPDATAVLVWAFSSSWRDRAPKLRLIATPAAGREWIHAEPGPNLQIWHGSYHGELMAETIVGMMFAFARGIKDAFDRRGEVWPRAEIAGGLRAVRGSHAVILGFGHIGKWIGRLLVPFGVRITGVNRSNAEAPDYFAPGDKVVLMDGLDAALPGADHLILALPGDTGTDGIVDARRLGLLRPGAYVYNVGRGNAIDMAALEDALTEGRLAGAGLDVFPEEPLPADARIRTCPGTILLPHVSAFAPGYFDVYMRELLPRLEAMFNKSPSES